MAIPQKIDPQFTLKQQLGNLKGLASQQYVDPEQVRKTAAQMTPSELFSNIMPSEKKRRLVQPVDQPTGQQGLAKSTSDVVPSDLQTYKNLWTKYYQTKNDPAKEAKFLEHNKMLQGHMPKGKEITAAIRQTLPAFSGEIESRGYTPEFMEGLLKATAAHESLGGKYNKQLGGGPARSWFQVEPDTAYDNIQNFGHALGKGYEKAVGYSADKLKGMSKEQVGQLLETDPNFAASMAALWYLRKMPKT